MAFQDTTTTFLVTRSIKKFTNFVIPTYFQSVQMSIIERKKVWYDLHRNKFLGMDD